MRLNTRARRAVVTIAGCSLLLHGPIALAARQGQPAPKPTTAPAAPATQKPAATTQKPATAKPATAKPAAAAASLPVDGGWPRIYDLPSGGSILLYQPQIASWEQQKKMVAFSAVSHRAKAAAADKPAVGTVKFEADTTVSVADRLVGLKNVKIVEASFQTLSKEQVQEVTSVVSKNLNPDDGVIALDRVLANLDKSGLIVKNVEGLKADPPTIFFSKTPAVIVNLDGDPIWSPIKENDLKYAVNTNWDLFQHEPSKTFYLRNNDTWLKAADVIKGPWTPAGTLPGSFKNLPPDDNWKEVKAALPGKAVAASAVPKVFVSNRPAELILLTGEPRYSPVTGTGLQWVSNTESDVFRMGRTGAVFYLVAGRWFSAPDFTGPWTFATPSLPEDFKKISLEHPRSRVLASVPGTDQAAEAVLIASIPQTARVNRKEVKAPEVASRAIRSSRRSSRPRCSAP
jgi:hypothetical protein